MHDNPYGMGIKQESCTNKLYPTILDQGAPSFRNQSRRKLLSLSQHVPHRSPLNPPIGKKKTFQIIEKTETKPALEPL